MVQVVEKRHIEHNLNLKLDEYGKDEVFVKKAEKAIEDLLATMPDHDEIEAVSSLGKKKEDATMYTGTGGNAYLYWRLYLLSKQTQDPQNQEEQQKTSEYYQKAVESSQIALIGLIESKDSRPPSPSFLMSQAGQLVLSSILMLEEKGSYEKVQAMVNDLTTTVFADCFDEKSAEDEILYGNAGYLYCLLLLRKHLHQNEHQELIQKLDVCSLKIVEDLYKQGWSEEEKRLQYSFPRGRKLYLGAAHGTFGILYMMLRAISSVPLI